MIDLDKYIDEGFFDNVGSKEDANREFVTQQLKKASDDLLKDNDYKKLRSIDISKNIGDYGDMNPEDCTDSKRAELDIKLSRKYNKYLKPLPVGTIIKYYYYDRLMYMYKKEEQNYYGWGWYLWNNDESINHYMKVQQRKYGKETKYAKSIPSYEVIGQSSLILNPSKKWRVEIGFESPIDPDSMYEGFFDNVGAGITEQIAKFEKFKNDICHCRNDRDARRVAREYIDSLEVGFGIAWEYPQIKGGYALSQNKHEIVKISTAATGKYKLITTYNILKHGNERVYKYSGAFISDQLTGIEYAYSQAKDDKERQWVYDHVWLTLNREKISG